MLLLASLAGKASCILQRYVRASSICGVQLNGKMSPNGVQGAIGGGTRRQRCQKQSIPWSTRNRRSEASDNNNQADFDFLFNEQTAK